jgi:hypothetical protein
MANNAEELGLELYNICDDAMSNGPSIAAMQSLITKGAAVNMKDDEYGDTGLIHVVNNGISTL